VGTAKRERQKANRQKRLEDLAKEAQRDKTRRWGLLIGGVVVGVTALLYVASRLANDDTSTPTTTTAVTTTTAAATDTTIASETTAAPTSSAEPTTTVEVTTTLPAPFAYGTAPCPAADGSSALPETFAGAPAKCIEDDKTYTAEVTTNKGNFTITLDAAKSPGNVNNFVALARYGFYSDSLCHRVVKGFVVQCGRPKSATDDSKPGYTVADELPFMGEYLEGVVAVANTGSADTGSGQWFVITGTQGVALPPQYSIIGTVTKGYDTTVKALENLADPTAARGEPLAEIVIQKVTITES
jgi:cyclophilin family peptidyl-prolyl cis-trans isomerase